jgi:hypothetical protein
MTIGISNKFEIYIDNTSLFSPNKLICFAQCRHHHPVRLCQHRWCGGENLLVQVVDFGDSKRTQQQTREKQL